MASSPVATTDVGLHCVWFKNVTIFAVILSRPTVFIIVGSCHKKCAAREYNVSPPNTICVG